MSITYCHECSEHIDTDYDTEHFCDCGTCLRVNDSAEYEPMCMECYEHMKDQINTDNQYRSTTQ